MNTYILSFITWLPAVGAILILALMKKDQSSLIKKFATGWFALDFIALALVVEVQPRHRRHAVPRRPRVDTDDRRAISDGC